MNYFCCVEVCPAESYNIKERSDVLKRSALAGSTKLTPNRTRSLNDLFVLRRAAMAATNSGTLRNVIQEATWSDSEGHQRIWLCPVLPSSILISLDGQRQKWTRSR